MKDIAGKEYWDNLWDQNSREIHVEEDSDNETTSNVLFQKINNYFQLNSYNDQKFSDYFHQHFKKLKTEEMSIVEIGCGSSEKLSYFANEFKFQVTGVDYSEIGCEQAEAALKNGNAKGEIVCADFFSPPENLIGTFDVVVSFGVAEHFEDTSGCIKAFGKFLKPGGMMITNIPNMTGAVGFFQKYIDNAVYKIHVLLNCKDLKNSHEKVGLEVQSCEYFFGIDWGVINIGKMEGKPNILLKLMPYILSWTTKIFWILEALGLRLKPNRLTSPYIMCCAIKRE
jgi:cyclopropane fatty-acyl-phospholipid synthase-like methyltransferase